MSQQYYLSSFFESLDSNRFSDLQQFKESINEFSKLYLEEFNYISHTRGLIAGHVQSGKTSHVFGAISAAADHGFRFFLLPTTDNVRLHAQTVSRARDHLKQFEVLDEREDVRFKGAKLDRPVLLVLKKNKRILETWCRNIQMHTLVPAHPIIIMDDEGDAASLNTQVNQNKESTIFRLIDAITKVSTASLNVAVTATPQANLLQDSSSVTKPSFVQVLPKYAGYLGGDFFYLASEPLVEIDESEKQDLLETEKIPEGLRTAILFFVFTCFELKAIHRQSNCNFLIHPSLKISDHKVVSGKVKKFLEEMISDRRSPSSVFRYWVGDIFKKLTTFQFSLDDSWDDLFAIMEEVNVVVINSEQIPVDITKGFNIVVGGNSLGRGITFPRLQVTYYCRTSKTPQADTVWQHSRLFGYDRVSHLAKVFAPAKLQELFKEFTVSNNALFQTLKDRGTEGTVILSPKGTRPTRKNVVRKNNLITLVGSVNYFTLDSDHRATEELDRILGLSDRSLELCIDDVISLFDTLSGRSTDSSLTVYANCLQSLSEAQESMCRVFVRPDRNISRRTGTLLSPNDRDLSYQYPVVPTVFFYRLNGTVDHGWDGWPVWVVNIKFPTGICFYSNEN